MKAQLKRSWDAGRMAREKMADEASEALANRIREAVDGYLTRVRPYFTEENRWSYQSVEQRGHQADLQKATQALMAEVGGDYAKLTSTLRREAFLGGVADANLTREAQGLGGDNVSDLLEAPDDVFKVNVGGKLVEICTEAGYARPAVEFFSVCDRDDAGRCEPGEGGGEPTDSAAFKAWFEGSEVADRKGKPLRVYHGTGGVGEEVSDQIESFEGVEMKFDHPKWLTAIGDWFTDDPEVADFFTNKGENPHVYPVYLAIKKPLTVDSYDELENMYQDAAADSVQGWREELIGEGYDGIIVERSTTDTGSVRTDYVPFNAEQVKSVFNRGTWNPKSRKISEASRFTAMSDRDVRDLHSTYQNEHQRNPSEKTRRWLKDLGGEAMQRGINISNQAKTVNGSQWDLDARKRFGVTPDPTEAGYLLADGEMLDMSGKEEGGTPGLRAYDHRQVGDAGDYPGGDDGMLQFMYHARAIRMHVGDDGEVSVDLVRLPTGEQRRMLSHLADSCERFYWDVTDWKTGDKVDGGEGFEEFLQAVNGRFKEAGLQEAGHEDQPRCKSTPESTPGSWCPSEEGSQVADEEGNPLLVYHGTRKDFENLRPSYNPKEQLGFGIHFATDESFAKLYAEDETVARSGKTPTVFSVVLDIKKPLDADAIVEEGTPEFELAEQLAGKKLFTQKSEDGTKRLAYLQGAIDKTSGKRAEKLIRAAGYDGVKYTARITQVLSPNTYKRGAEGTTWIVFDPKQIRVIKKQRLKESGWEDKIGGKWDYGDQVYPDDIEEYPDDLEEAAVEIVGLDRMEEPDPPTNGKRLVARVLIPEHDGRVWVLDAPRLQEAGHEDQERCKSTPASTPGSWCPKEGGDTPLDYVRGDYDRDRLAKAIANATPGMVQLAMENVFRNEKLWTMHRNDVKELLAPTGEAPKTADGKLDFEPESIEGKRYWADSTLQNYAEKFWNEAIDDAISRGDLPWGEGHYQNQNREMVKRGYYNAEDKHWAVLPDTLYHATTALSKVMDEGLKTRAELGQRFGKGLGGGTDEAISFTDDPKMAQRIAESILEFRATLRGEVSPQQMYDQAKSGEGAKQPWVNLLSSLYGGQDWAKNPSGIPQRLKDVLDGVRVLHATWLTDAQKEELQAHGVQIGGMLVIPKSGLPAGYKISGVEGQHWWPGGDGLIRASEITRPATEKERLDDLTEFYKRWSTAREHEGKGPVDPLFFSSDYEAIKNLDPKEVGVVEVAPHQPGKTHGWKMSALGEWRVKSGQYVDVLRGRKLREAEWRPAANLQEANRLHKPAGSPDENADGRGDGGQFASKDEGEGGDDRAAALETILGAPLSEIFQFDWMDHKGPITKAEFKRRGEEFAHRIEKVFERAVGVPFLHGQGYQPDLEVLSGSLYAHTVEGMLKKVEARLAQVEENGTANPRAVPALQTARDILRAALPAAKIQRAQAEQIATRVPKTEEERQADESRTRQSEGTCPVCGSQQGAPERGGGEGPASRTMAKHGYRIPWGPGRGTTTGCPGTHTPPWEVSPEGAEQYLDTLKRFASGTRRALKGLDTAQSVEVTDKRADPITGKGQTTKTIKRGEPGFDNVIRSRRQNLEIELRREEEAIKETRERIKKWKPVQGYTGIPKHLLKEADFDPEKHPRHPAGSPEGGEFAPKGSVEGEKESTENVPDELIEERLRQYAELGAQVKAMREGEAGLDFEGKSLMETGTVLTDWNNVHPSEQYATQLYFERNKVGNDGEWANLTDDQKLSWYKRVEAFNTKKPDLGKATKEMHRTLDHGRQIMEKVREVMLKLPANQGRLAMLKEGEAHIRYVDEIFARYRHDLVRGGARYTPEEYLALSAIMPSTGGPGGFASSPRVEAWRKIESVLSTRSDMTEDEIAMFQTKLNQYRSTRESLVKIQRDLDNAMRFGITEVLQKAGLMDASGEGLPLPKLWKVSAVKNFKFLAMQAWGSYPADWRKQMQEKFPQLQIGKTRGYGRGHFSSAGPYSRIKSPLDTGVLAHEFGHGMEHSMPALRALETAFYEYRTKGEELLPLYKLLPGHGYKRSEKTRPDKFADAYSGKFYDSAGPYELFTMGIQWLVRGDRDQMLSLKDPEHAAFTVGVLARLRKK